MNRHTTRRGFLAAGMAAPAAGLAATSPLPSPLSSPAGSPQDPKVDLRPLGRTGMKVSRLAFGCMLASDPLVLERAIDLGINYFDTARVYQGGNNERMVGGALKGKRDKVFLVTKAISTTKTEILNDLDTSLRELGTDYVDVWFIHNKNTPEEVKDELLEAQAIAKDAGKIRFRGLSFHFNMPRMLEHTLKLGVIDVALLSYNFTLGEEVGEAIIKARKQGLGIVAMKVMAGGYARIQRGDRLYGQEPSALTARLKRPNAMLAALKWTLKNPSVDTAIIGMTNFEELEEDMRAMSEPFSGQDAETLARQRELIRPLYCHACGACGGVCGRGVRVADTLRQLMYAEGYGQFPMARASYLDQPVAARAASCKDCGECTVNCPNGVNVRANLIRAQEMFA